MKAAFFEFKVLADQKKVVTDADLEALMDFSSQQGANADNWELSSVYVTSGDSLTPSATVSMTDPDGKSYTDAAVGVGAVDAVFKAVERIVGTKFVLDNFTVQSVTDSSDALGRVTVRIHPPTADDTESQPTTFSGHGTHIDILVASARALVNAVNKMHEGLSPEHQRTVEMPGKEF